MPHDIFLSYSRADADIMQRLYSDLNAAGLSVWIDQTGIPPGTASWRRAIEEAIENTTCMVVLLSPDAKNSKWVNAEIEFAEVHSKQIFPVLVRGDEKTSVPFGFATSQWVDLRETNKYRMNFARLTATVKTYLDLGEVDDAAPLFNFQPVSERRPATSNVSIEAKSFTKQAAASKVVKDTAINKLISYKDMMRTIATGWGFSSLLTFFLFYLFFLSYDEENLSNSEAAVIKFLLFLTGFIPALAGGFSIIEALRKRYAKLDIFNTVFLIVGLTLLLITVNDTLIFRSRIGIYEIAFLFGPLGTFLSPFAFGSINILLTKTAYPRIGLSSIFLVAVVSPLLYIICYIPSILLILILSSSTNSDTSFLSNLQNPLETGISALLWALCFSLAYMLFGLS